MGVGDGGQGRAGGKAGRGKAGSGEGGRRGRRGRRQDGQSSSDDALFDQHTTPDLLQLPPPAIRSLLGNHVEVGPDSVEMWHAVCELSFPILSMRGSCLPGDVATAPLTDPRCPPSPPRATRVDLAPAPLLARVFPPTMNSSEASHAMGGKVGPGGRGDEGTRATRRLRIAVTYAEQAPEKHNAPHRQGSVSARIEAVAPAVWATTHKEYRRPRRRWRIEADFDETRLDFG